MNKLLLSGIVIIFLAACNNAAKTGSENAATDSGQVSTAPADTANAPVLSFENSSYDFGKVTAGEKVSYQFKFKNTGKSPLIISNALASCGCTVPDYPHSPIPPGNEGTINVIFDSAGKSGMQDKVITLTANTVPQTTQLHLTGEVNLK